MTSMTSEAAYEAVEATREVFQVADAALETAQATMMDALGAYTEAGEAFQAAAEAHFASCDAAKAAVERGERISDAQYERGCKLSEQFYATFAAHQEARKVFEMRQAQRDEVKAGESEARAAYNRALDAWLEAIKTDLGRAVCGLTLTRATTGTAYALARSTRRASSPPPSLRPPTPSASKGQGGPASGSGRRHRDSDERDSDR